MPSRQTSDLLTGIDNLKKEVEQLRQQISLKENEIKNLEELMLKAQTTYDHFSNFPQEVNNFHFYKPKRFRIERQDGSKTNGYVLKYGSYQISISDRPDESYPETFKIVNHHLKDSITCQHWISAESNLPLIVRIYYQDPNQVINSYQLSHAPLLDFSSVLDRAQTILGSNWCDELSFGLLVFYYWIRIYYRVANSINPDYQGLYRMFEPDLN